MKKKNKNKQSSIQKITPESKLEFKSAELSIVPILKEENYGQKAESKTLSPNRMAENTKKAVLESISVNIDNKTKKGIMINTHSEKSEASLFPNQQNSIGRGLDQYELDQHVSRNIEGNHSYNQDPYRIRKSFSEYENEIISDFRSDCFNNSYYRGSFSSSPRLNKSNYYMNDENESSLFKSAMFFKSYGNQNNISFESILYKIYFEGYCFDDIKDNIFPPLRRVKNVESFFELLFSVIKTYCIKIREHILGDIDEIIIKKERLIKSKDGRFEIRNEFSGYMKFSKDPSAYINIVNKIYELVESLTIISKDIDRIIEIYLELHNLDKKSIEFDCLDLHKNMFARYVYEAPLVKHFINEVSMQFSKSEIYQSKFSRTLYQLIQLNQPLGNQVKSQVQNNEESSSISKDSSNSKENTILNSEDAKTIDNSSKKKKKKKKKSEKATPTKLPESNKENDVISQPITTKEDINTSPSQKKDSEIDEFEKKLLLEHSNNRVKIKPNISEEWIQSLKQRLQKQRKN